MTRDTGEDKIADLVGESNSMVKQRETRGRERVFILRAVCTAETNEFIFMPTETLPHRGTSNFSRVLLRVFRAFNGIVRAVFEGIRWELVEPVRGNEWKNYTHIIRCKSCQDCKRDIKQPYIMYFESH